MKAFPLFCLVFCLLIACAEPPVQTPGPTLVRTEIAAVTATAISTPTSPPPNNTPTPTATLHPTITPTPTPTLVPVLAGTAVSPSTAAIVPENVSQVTELARWGRGVINDVAVSGNGRWIAVGTTTGVYIHDAQDLTIEPRFFETPDSVTTLAISYEGDLVAMSLNQRAFELWNIRTNDRLEHKIGSTQSVQFSPDDSYLAAVVEADGFVWSIPEATVAQNYPGVLSMKFSGDGSRLAVWTYGQASIYSWPEAVLLDEMEPILFAPSEDDVFNADGTLLADIQFTDDNKPILLNLPNDIAYGPSGRVELQSNDNTLLLSLPPIDLLAPRRQPQYACNLPLFFADPPGLPQVWRFEYLSSAQIIALNYVDLAYPSRYSRQSSVQYYHLDSGKQLYTVEEGINGFAFLPDGETWVSGSQDGRLQIRRITNGEVLQEFDGYESPVLDVVVSPDNEVVAVQYLDEVKLYRANNGTVLYRLPVGKIAFSPDGSILALSAQNGQINLHNIADGSLRTTLPPQQAAITALAFTTSGDKLVSANRDCQINVWQLTNGTVIAQLETPLVAGFEPDELVPARIGGLTVIQDDKIVMGAFASSIGFWNLSDGTLLNVVEPNNYLNDFAYLPAYDQLIVSGRPIRQWRILSGLELQELKPIETSGIAVALSPDGQLLVAGQDEYHADQLYDGAIEFVSSEQGASLQVMTPGTRAVSSLVFAGDGTVFYSASLDGVVRIWGLP